ncbi:translation initiation factor IF-2 [Elasticomyces elasticus]|uniref:Translation initiation factor IF-2, mitochondrial n=1 Tax=Exophiala sideris TaxID=1016849 RepID=A0ABR0JHR1_9EURO|nr:translation initiation factor IF-2 [Elasticomyces elasticus]KAK5024013.1 translation initiation factor IF-2 [Exophiala sideris]KAK5025599.1 translation initiation factor IF-2 [Exophiala sideris]KAK5063676.1 translation initiation factor IF-2 [Exophiala sideris]KAK5176384.1 translation initiation factor IF-2 [Eurotiomycetes sp. CCFEE 6388]
MRRVVTRRILQRQDICLFCAFKHGADLRPANNIGPPRRLYRSSAPSHRPAGAAAARIEDDDDLPSPPRTRELLGWKCRCGHVNASRRSECTICTTSRPQNAELVYKSQEPVRAAPTPVPRPPPPSSPSSLPSPIAPPFRKPQSSDPSEQVDLPSAFRGREARNTRGNVLDQAETNFNQQRSRAQYGPRDDMRTRDRTGYYPGQRERREAAADGPRIRFHGTNQHLPERNSEGTTAPSDRPEMPLGGRSKTWKPSSKPDASAEQGSGWNERTVRRWRPSDNNVDSQPSAESLDRGSATGSRIGATISPMGRDRPSRTDFPRWDGFDASRSRGNDQQRSALPRQRRPPPQQFVSPSSRKIDLDNTTGDAEPPGASAETLAEGSEVEPLTEEEEERFARKQRLEKDRDRRSRLYDVEGEEPHYVTQRPKFSTGKSRSAPNRTNNFDPDELDELLDGGGRRKKKSKKAKKEVAQRPEIQLPEFISVEKLAQGLKVRLPDFMAKLEEEGFEGARYDHILDSGTSAMFAETYGFEPVINTIDATGDLVPRPPPEDPSILPPRPPIVTIMGHVDHGKTTILDHFRKSSVVASEHGGITQHIGAFSVVMPGSERNITFLDTPGHAAFLDMRRRGANVTDIVVLVVAADDSVKAQTKEAIKHAQEAGVQIIVAINKIDKEDADVERVKLDLIQHDIVVEDHGGDYQSIPVSGKTGQGMADLEEAILTLADVADFRAEADGPAEGWIIESKVGVAGRVATVLVRRGTLRAGDFIVAGNTWARVRTLRNDSGQLIEEAPPGTPVQIDGWRGEDPMAGSEVLQAETEQQAKDAIAVRQEREEAARAMGDMEAINVSRAEEAEARAKVLEWEKEQGYTAMKAYRRPKDNEGWIEKESAGPKQVHFVIKADVAGSTEALVAAVSGIGNKEVVVDVIHSGTGELTESDIKLLASTGEVGYAISFNQPIDGSIRRLAEAAKLQILDHNIIYKVTDVVTEKLSDELPPIITQRVLGEAEVGEVFEITVKKQKVKIAGCRITNGTVRRSEKIRVSRNGEVVYTGMLNSFKNIKKDVTEMRKGSECGMGFENWDDFQVGDQIQSFEEIHERRTLY